MVMASGGEEYFQNSQFVDVSDDDDDDELTVVGTNIAVTQTTNTPAANSAPHSQLTVATSLPTSQLSDTSRPLTNGLAAECPDTLAVTPVTQAVRSDVPSGMACEGGRCRVRTRRHALCLG